MTNCRWKSKIVPYKTATMWQRAASYVCLVLCCLHSSAAEVELTPPWDVSMITLNAHYTLSWEWDQRAQEFDNVTFTAEYVAMYKLQSKKKTPTWSTACEDTPDRFCDLTEFDLHYLGIYMLRVRANANGSHSDWVQKEFCPDKDADIGPPSKVDLAPAGSGLDVFMSDPLSSTGSSMKDNIADLYYRILVWERSAGRQASTTEPLDSSANLVTVSKLKPWTWYCVSVQSRYDFYDKKSNFTSPLCMKTEGAVPWWQIVGYFVGSLVVCFLAVLLVLYSPFWCFQKVKKTLHPSTKLAPHFTQHLCDSPGSDIPRLLTLDPESELLCDNVTLVPEPTDLEVLILPPETLTGPPSGLQPDSSGRHSRQNSSSSGDSGVYSTGGSSGNMQHPNHSLSLAEDCLKGRVDLEKLKMQDMVAGLNSRLTADEGTADMSV
ncbi:interferon alpha/beta receptor 1b-like [Mugil cephalus]|uniref:interferon alpha/beta receptor 1b-like n=1 Tax=Mugil cephalus TaxID=48193 RepID=UPI001FB5EA7E|nr:interferon alpha/beta receptor 1b-like [Mugil cephalus]